MAAGNTRQVTPSTSSEAPACLIFLACRLVFGFLLATRYSLEFTNDNSRNCHLDLFDGDAWSGLLAFR
jgi:hypothetical protein